jgi:hypothetical protein
MIFKTLVPNLSRGDTLFSFVLENQFELMLLKTDNTQSDYERLITSSPFSKNAPFVK